MKLIYSYLAITLLSVVIELSAVCLILYVILAFLSLISSMADGTTHLITQINGEKGRVMHVFVTEYVMYAGKNIRESNYAEKDFATSYFCSFLYFFF